MQKDPFEAEAMEGYDAFGPDEIEKDLLEINSRLNKRVKRKTRFTGYRIAASIALITGLSLAYFFISDREIREVPVKTEISESIELPEKKAIDEMEKKPEATEDKAKKGLDEKGFPEEMPVGESTAPPVVKKDKVVKRPELDMPEMGDEIVQLKESEKAKREIQPNELAEGTATARASDTVRMAVEDQIVYEEEKEIASKEYNRQLAVASKKSLTPEIQSAEKRESLISGVVLSAEDSLPVPGATVWVKGTDTGTVTDEQGRFTLVPKSEGANELNIDLIGMEPVKTTVSRNTNLEILMQPDSPAEDEIVIVSQGEPHHDSTGAVSIVRNVDGTTENSYQNAYPLEGKIRFKKYIEENMVFPGSELEKAVVELKFIISPSGKPVNIEVVRSPGDKFSREAIRLLVEGPKWSPAKNEGKYIGDENKIRIVFKK